MSNFAALFFLEPVINGRLAIEASAVGCAPDQTIDFSRDHERAALGRDGQTGFAQVAAVKS